MNPLDMDGLSVALASVRIDADSLSVLATIDAGSIVGLTVPGDRALDLWRALRALVPTTGRWPLVLGDSGPDGLVVGEGFDRAEALIARGLAFDLEAFWHERVVEDPEDDPDLAELIGEIEVGLPDEASLRLITASDLLTGEPLPDVALALLPTARSWEAPALLAFGGWNENPEPHQHVAILRAWRERYGADLVAMSGDSIEMLVERPPTDEAGALALARQQYAYCYDIVDQGTITIERLAATLRGHPLWTFWWD